MTLRLKRRKAFSIDSFVFNSIYANLHHTPLAQIALARAIDD